MRPLPVGINEAESVEEGQAVARNLLEQAGVPTESIKKAYGKMSEYSDVSRAILVDIRSGLRSDDRNKKGIWVSRMDWLTVNFEKWADADQYKIPRSQRVKEALVLAAKVSAHPAAAESFLWMV